MLKRTDLGAKLRGKWSIQLYDDYAAAEEVWRRLETDGRCTPFQTYDWVTAWYEAAGLGNSVEPLVVVALRGREPEVLLPLVKYNRGRLSVISFPDLGVSDYTAPVIAADTELSPAEVRSMMAEVLAALPPCDLVHFNKLAEHIDGTPNPLRWLKGTGLSTTQCFGLPLEASWTKQAERVMDRPLLTTIKRRRAQIAKLGTLTFDQVTDPLALARIWDATLTMRLARFRKLGRQDMLTDAAWQGFYRRLATKTDRTLDVSIATMALNDTIVASCFGITRGSTYYMLIPTFQMGEWDRFMPGMQLFNEMIGRQAAAGIRYFDFTIGNEGYKLRFGAKQRPLFEWLSPRSAKGIKAYIAWRVKLVLARNPRMFDLAKKARAWLRASPPADNGAAQ